MKTIQSDQKSGGKTVGAMKDKKSFLNEYKTLRSIFQSAADKCLPKLTEKCDTAELVVNKALRLTMDMVYKVLQKDPNVKVIYLVRDPRGIVLSRKTVKYISQIWESDLESESTLVCPKMTRDYEGFEQVKSAFPERVKLVRYEDVADRPLEMVKQIYKFIGE